MKPSIVIVSPSRTFVPLAANSPSATRSLIASAPQTAGMPSPRATTAAWEFVPPALVRMPWAAIMPW